ncbi:MAG: cysteine--tRNA ligase [Dehalococcoidia bacterium]|nr:cysteine--tRNA ligase [Dehalococcoidia bacterium]
MKISNTASGQKEEFVPAGDVVKMYVCGITPQSEAHIGHAMSYINFDIIRRYLKFRGYTVQTVQNFTDIDDKIIMKAHALAVTIEELTRKNIASFNEDMTALNISPMDVYPRATQEIPAIIEMVQGLIDRGFAYPAAGSVYFRVQKPAGYGRLSHRTLDQMLAGARIEPGDEKENPMDFVLWKAAKPGEPSWDSPWGPGRPGWHIECSAMSLKYLGEQIDIHGGGADLVFPHHENESAQSEAYTGKAPFVRYWMHNGLLKLGDEKMSKSIGNIVSIRQVLSKYPSDAMRVFVLNSHYRSPLTYTPEALEAASSGAERLRQAVEAKSQDGNLSGYDTAALRQRFIEAMDDDFNTPKALAALFDAARELNRLRDDKRDISEGQAALRELGGVLGLTFKPLHKPLEEADAAAIQALVDKRTELRKAKQYQQADEVRRQLDAMGVAVEDTPQGVVWKTKR